MKHWQTIKDNKGMRFFGMVEPPMRTFARINAEGDYLADVGDLTVVVAEIIGGVTFGYTLMAAGPDHGITWELEDTRQFSTPVDALVAGAVHATILQQEQQ